jgi:hypothetical protein
MFNFTFHLVFDTSPNILQTPYAGQPSMRGCPGARSPPTEMEMTTTAAVRAVKITLRNKRKRKCATAASSASNECSAPASASASAPIAASGISTNRKSATAALSASNECSAPASASASAPIAASGMSTNRKSATAASSASNECSAPASASASAPIAASGISTNNLIATHKVILSQSTKAAIATIEREYKCASEDVRQAIQASINQSFRRHQPSPPPPQKVDFSVPVINLDAFDNFPPSGNAVGTVRQGKNREEYHREIGNTNYDPKVGAIQARNRAVRKIVKEVLAAGDDDQIALTLMWTLDHNLVKPYLNRIARSYYSEEVIVGLHAAHGMESIVRRVIEGKETGGRSTDCRALLVMVGMCLSKGIEEDNAVSKRAVWRTVLSSMTRPAAYRLMKEGANKLKSFESAELRSFCAVDKAAKRWKYNDNEINDLREWMVSSNRCRDSPNEKDVICERDIFGM